MEELDTSEGSGWSSNLHTAAKRLLDRSFLLSSNNNKMKKLELKHLMPYLPYGLNWFCLDQDSREFETLPTVKVIDFEKELFEIGGMDIDISELPYPDGLTVKPILRLLSDLNIELVNELLPSMVITPDDIKEMKSTPIGHWKYYQVISALQMHIDIHGLIDAELAIDINTINP